MLIIKQEDLIGQGSTRKVYRYREQPNKCLKIVFDSKRVWWKMKKDENKKDISNYRLLSKRKNFSQLLEFIPKFYGTIDTNFGKAIVVEYIDNCLTIEDFIKKYGLTEQLKKKLFEMIKLFYENNVQIRDIKLDNYVVRLNKDNGLTLKIIDGLGNSQLIPLATYIDFFGKIQLKRRLKRIFEYIVLKFPQYKNILNDCISFF